MIRTSCGNRKGALASWLSVLTLSASGALAAPPAGSPDASGPRNTVFDQRRSVGAAVNGVELGGPVSYTLAGQTLDLKAGSICNHGSESETNNLRLELWALPQSFSGGSISGTKLGQSFTHGGLFQSQCLDNFDSGSVALLDTPPDGVYFVVLFLMEYENAPSDDGFSYDDFSQFPNTISVTGGVITVGTTSASSCVPGATALCIDDQPGDKRFKVQAGFSTSQGGGRSGNGQAIALSPLGVNQGGLLWFFSASNPELLVKVLNGCGVNNSYWVFASAGTNVGLTLAITDTKTGRERVYTNPDLQAAVPIQDTGAFPCQ